MPNWPERQRIIDAMVGIARNDAPWIWGFFPKDYLLYHGWLSNVKPNDMARNDVKYLRLEPGAARGACGANGTGRCCGRSRSASRCSSPCWFPPSSATAGASAWPRARRT